MEGKAGGGGECLCGGGGEQGHGRGSAVHVVRYTACGEFVVSGGADRLLCLWRPGRVSVGGGCLVTRFDSKGRVGGGILDVDVSGGDNGWMVSCGREREVSVWDVGRGVIVRRLRGHIAAVNSVRYMDEGGVLVVSGSYDAGVRVWDMRGGGGSSSCVQVLEGAGDSVSGVCYVEGKGWIVAGSVDGAVRSYDVRMGRLVTVDMPGRGAVVGVSEGEKGSGGVVGSVHGSRVVGMGVDGGEAGREGGEGVQCVEVYKGHVNEQYRVQSGYVEVSTSGRGGGGGHKGMVWSGSEDGFVYLWPHVCARGGATATSPVVTPVGRVDVYKQGQKAKAGVANKELLVESVCFNPRNPAHMVSSTTTGRVMYWNDVLACTGIF
eukprot:Nk52_evm2s684 gene=Nk52_evmTU2s684